MHIFDRIDKKKDKNYGIAILRVLLAYMVVIDHFYNSKRKKKFLHILYYHIPTFFLLSFYFTYNTLTKFNITKIKLRFERLVIPYFCWSVIAWIINNIYFYILDKKCSHSLYAFLHNILNGHIFILALWFQNILILTTLVITIIVFFFKNEFLLIFQILMIVSYKFQYSGDNYYFFKKYFRANYYNTYGRFFETLPNSITGFFLAAFCIPNKMQTYKIRTVIISIIVLGIISSNKFENDLKTFKYGGIRLNIASICIFLIFYLSLNSVYINKKIIKIIDISTNYTAGIYFIHYLIGKGYIMNFLLSKKLKTFFGCFIIYIFSFVTCILLDKLIGKTKLRHLIK
jgi:fucose 4-O-acetylase-like acetyltransferase